MRNTDGEKVYQIYTTVIYWAQDASPDCEYSNWRKLSSGRVKNSTSFERMCKEETTLEQAQQWARQWWINYIYTKVGLYDKMPLINKNPDLLTINTKFLEWESWCLTRFSHFTYNINLSDEELLDSFSRFVRRKVHEDWIISQGPNYPAYKQAKEDSKHLHCLMGAEDRWRWKGPCRCAGCVKLGIARIDH